MQGRHRRRRGARFLRRGGAFDHAAARVGIPVRGHHTGHAVLLEWSAMDKRDDNLRCIWASQAPNCPANGSISRGTRRSRERFLQPDGPNERVGGGFPETGSPRISSPLAAMDSTPSSVFRLIVSQADFHTEFDVHVDARHTGDGVGGRIRVADAVIDLQAIDNVAGAGRDRPRHSARRRWRTGRARSLPSLAARIVVAQWATS